MPKSYMREPRDNNKGFDGVEETFFFFPESSKL